MPDNLSRMGLGDHVVIADDGVTTLAKSPQKLAINLTTFVDIVRIRWQIAPVEWGNDGLKMAIKLRRTDVVGSIIISHALYNDVDWIQASISYRKQMPTYEDLVWLHRAVYGQKRWAYQIFTPRKDHISFHDFTLHLWGRADGKNELPGFAFKGMI